MFDTELDTDLSAEDLAERERRADELHKVIGRAIAASPGVDADTIVRAAYTQLAPELRETLAAGGDEAEQLTELRSLVEVELVTRRVDE
jgi:hypothetical protein